MFRRSLLYFIFSAFLISSAFAQGADGLGGYVPPPLFGAKNFPPADHKPDNLGLPPVSKTMTSESEDKADRKRPLIRGRVIKQVEEKPVEVDLPVSPLREAKPKPVKTEQVVPKPVEKPKKKALPNVELLKEYPKKIEVKSGPEPIDLLKKEDVPPPPSFKEPIKSLPIPVPPKVMSKGVVKGPKTMPSNKKKRVEAEVTFESSDKVEQLNILERVKSPPVTPQDVPLKSEKEIARIKEVIPLPVFNEQDDRSKKLVMLYLETQFEVKETQINTLEQLIIPALEANASARVIIEAYASSQDDSLNSARRLSLSRALAVRDYLLTQKIETNRIDVRALGAESNMQPLDRVELIVAP